MNTNKSVVKQVLDVINEVKSDTVVPPFFDVDLKNNPKKSSREGKKKPEVGKDLKRGVNDKMLGDFDDKDYRDFSGRDIRVLEFRDPRHFEEAMWLLADDPEIGHPTYERGIDGKSIIFHLWKADDKMKEKINKAIGLLKKWGLVQDTVQYPHYRKNR